MAWRKPSRQKILRMIDLADRKGFTVERYPYRTDGWKMFDAAGNRIQPDPDTPLFTTEGATLFLLKQAEK